MNNVKPPAQPEIDRLYGQLDRDAKSGGYNLNPDKEFAGELVQGLLVNQQRYGYQVCPCRLAVGVREKDMDIICPCDYRDPDVNEFGACYCGLYVSQDIVQGKKKLGRIPERRGKASPGMAGQKKGTAFKLPLPVWRCKVCGYLCAREQAPEVCPICKVKKERFERFM